MTIPLHTVARGDGSLITAPRRVIVRSAPEWRDLWREHAGEETPVPDVDFETRMVAAVFAGEKPTPGGQVLIARAHQEETALVLQVTEGHPPPGAVAAQILAAPFHIVSLPRFDGDARFDAAGHRPLPAFQSPARKRHEAAPSSTGLSPRSAAALAYLAGPLSGALLLAVEGTSRFVRFHAFQALIALGALGIAAVLFLGLAFLFLLFSPSAFWAMVWLSALTAVAWLGVWGVCLFQAYQGRLWKLPIAGESAERWAGLVGSSA
jgi:uncharacterized membrane protein